MADMTLDELKSQLSGVNEYQGEDEETLRKRAEAAYAPTYQQSLTDLRNLLNTQLAQQNRSALANGMQRSSYNQAQQASLRTGGLQAESQLSAQYQGNVGQALLNLMEAEKERKLNADNQRDALLLQLYNMTPKSSGNPGNNLTVNGLPVNKYTDNTSDNDLDVLLNGKNPLTVTYITPNYTTAEREAYEKNSAAQRNAARKGTTVNTTSPKVTGYNVVKDYNSYSLNK